MRLLRTSTFRLESFFNNDIPPYAILSHTWGDEELTLQELQEQSSIYLLEHLYDYSKPDTWGEKHGFIKIAACAAQARKDGFEYMWCDSCCIDKTNSTELSEAINSMYHWYKGHLCYAYLADVPPSPDGAISLKNDAPFTQSRWFTRGWTLQELIAPSSVVFFDKNWNRMGTRSEFASFISDKTGIDRAVLGGEDPQSSSIAKRMSWASQRETTRIEDLAYSLMGLFGVNMPLLYGERDRAFLRLQEEIMKISDDHSLFAWTGPVDPNFAGNFVAVQSGLLASSPAYFSDSRHIVPSGQHGKDDDAFQAPYSMTNKGIRITLPIAKFVSSLGGENDVLAALNCHDETDSRGPLGIYLFHCGGRSYRRSWLNMLIPTSACFMELSGVFKPTDLYVGERAGAVAKERFFQFHFPELPVELSQHGLKLHVVPKPLGWDYVVPSPPLWDPLWNEETRILRCRRGLVCAIYLARDHEYKYEHGHAGHVLLIGIDKQLRPRCNFDNGMDILRMITEYEDKQKRFTRKIRRIKHWRIKEVFRSSGKPRVLNDFELAWKLLWYRSFDESKAKSYGHKVGMTGRDQYILSMITGGRYHWDNWVSGDGERETSLTVDFGSWDYIERPNPHPGQSKFEMVYKKLDINIGTVIEDKEVNGQTMFSLRIITTPESETKGNDHSMTRARNKSIGALEVDLIDSLLKRALG
ncbi:HET-domain-containing protein [Lophium mytilinum]|uniref:HET-domain-containing protein n=1 Tax=Lophium mytilinum TaxID=390894 RepID=A0A6A6Q8Q0_9PEZI|nr:HET-domain-containing protein [Lophium mytilinum]